MYRIARIVPFLLLAVASLALLAACGGKGGGY
jgi:predicted small lipoprotein YifL